MEPDNKLEKTSEPEQNPQGIPRRNSIELQKIDSTAPNYSAEKYDLEKSEKGRTASRLRPEIIDPPTGIGSWMTCLKYGLFATNFIIFIFGLAIIVVCGWMKMDPDFWDFQLNLDMTQFSKALYIGIAAGVIIILIALHGCLGTFFENTVMLLVYIIILFVVIFLEAAVVGIVWSSTNKSEFGEEMRAVIRKAISQIEDNDESRYFMDLLQNKLRCCGLDEKDDKNVGEKLDIPVPPSCIDQSTGFPYTTNCVNAIVEYLKQKAAILGGLFIVLLLFELGTLVPAVCLCCGLRQGK